MPNLPMWACPKPAGSQTSQAQPAFNVLLFQKNWPMYLLRYTTSIQRSQESMSRAVTVSHIIYDFCIDFGAAHAPAALNSWAGTRHARHRRPVTAPCGTTGAAYIRPVVLVLGCTTKYIIRTVTSYLTF